MNAIVGVLGSIISLAVWVLKDVAARWGYKVGLVAAVLTVYATVWLSIRVLVTQLTAMIPASGPVLGASIAFLPGHASVATAASIYFGTVATVKAWDYFRLVAGLAAKVGS